MKVLVTGASGMLGGAVYREALRRGNQVEGWAGSTRQTPDGLTFRVRDLANNQWLDLITAYRPELTINCAALTDADYCETHKEEAWTMNAWVPGELAAATRRWGGTRFIHISTDAIYDDSGPGRRCETDKPNPQSVYARTKLQGEDLVRAADPNALVVRTTMFGWTVLGKRPKFAEAILGALANNRSIDLFHDAYFSPLHVDMLAQALLDLAETDTSGILNVGATHSVSKADFGHLIADAFGLDHGYIQRVSVDDVSLIARRTKNVSLDVAVVERLLGRMPRVENGIQQLLREVLCGKAQEIRGRKAYP